MKRYEVVRLIGEGGMGRVYEAIDRKNGRAVAIKTLRSTFVDATSQRLILNEATAAARVRHPGIVELFDLQRDDHGIPYLVMELVDGADIGSWVPRWPGWHVVSPALLQVADAVAAAHAHGVVHGDLKPANIMRTRDGGCKLIDLGIARIADLHKDSQTAPAGTPVYMAPEQFDRGGLIGPWTDLYAFGVILAELIGGRPPFEGTTIPQIMLSKMRGEIRTTPRAGLTVPPELTELIVSLVRPRPRQRPRFAAVLRGILARASRDVRDEVVDLAPPTIERMPKLTAVAATVSADPTIRDEPSSTDEMAKISSDLSGGALLDAPASAGVLQARPSPILGRDDELTILGDAMRQTCAEGGVRAVVLCGSAGAGKSRLARQGLFWAEERGLMDSVAATYDPERPYGVEALSRAFRAVLGTNPEQWAGAAPSTGPLADHLQHWLAASEPIRPEVVAEIAHATLVHMSRERAIFLLLDDVDAARDGAVELVSMLLARQEARVLVVATARGTKKELEESHAAAIGAHPQSVVLEIGPLEPRAKRELVRSIAPLAPRVIEELASLSDDTPLLVMHRVRDWQSAEVLMDTPEGLVPRLPHTVNSLVLEHPLDRVLSRRVRATLSVLGAQIEAAERAVVQMALLGMRFEERLLRAAVAHDALVDDVLDVMLLEGLLVAEGSGVYHFDHALIRNALLEPLAARPDARTIHAEIAAALIEVYGDVRLDVNVQVAFAMRKAGNPAAWERLTKSALEYFRGGLFETGDDLVGTAAKWLREDGVPDSHELRGDLFALHAHGAYFQIDYVRARETIAHAIAIYESLPRTESLAYKIARARHRVAGIDFYTDRFLDCERTILEVRKLARIDHPLWAHIGAVSEHLLAEIDVLRGDWDAADAHHRAEMQFAEQTSGTWYRFFAMLTMVETLVVRNDIEGARALFENAIAVAGGAEQVVGETEDARIWLDLAANRYETARTLLRPKLAELERRKDPWRLTGALAHEALVSSALDRLDEARGAVKRFIAAYRAVAHDEPATRWSIERLIALLEARGAADAATMVRGAYEKRLRAIADALAG